MPRPNPPSRPSDPYPGYSESAWRNRFTTGIIEWKDPADLLASPNNHRVHERLQQEQVETLLNTFGWLQAVLVSHATDTVVDGHLRIILAIRHNTQVPVLYLDLSEAEERAALASLDYTASKAGIDLNILATNVQFMEMEFPALEVVWENFKIDFELNGNGHEPQDAPSGIDRAAELQEKWQVQPGEMFEIGAHRLICGDCTDAAIVARVMGGEKANLLMTSPPYWVGKDYEIQKSEKEIDDFISVFTQSCLLAMSDDFSRIVINTGTGMATKLNENESRIILLLDKYANNYLAHGWKLRHIRHWIKGGGRDRPGRPIDDQVYFGVEYLLTFYKSGRKSRGQNRISENWPQQSNWSDIQGDKQENNAGFPLEIPERFIKLYTLEKELVFEPFGGNGTTLVACENLSRRGRGIEISPAYCAVILERMTTACPALPVARVSG